MVSQLEQMGLFTPTTSATPVGRGSLISFNYPKSMSYDPNRIHDPSPMLIITDVRPTYIRGINLHYLTVPYVKSFLLRNGRNANFNYATNIKPDKYLANSFRMYYRQGMQQQRRLDTTFLLQLLAVVRSFSPDELDRIRNELKQQIEKRVQVKAAELNSYTEWQNQMRLQKTQMTTPTTTQPMQPQIIQPLTNPQEQPQNIQPPVINPNG